MSRARRGRVKAPEVGAGLLLAPDAFVELRQAVAAVYAHHEPARRQTEARSWLRQGYTTRAMVDQLRARVAEKRGEAAADQLVADMRAQWAARASWL